VWLIVLFLIPFIIVFKISFSEVRLAMPPVAPLLEWLDGKLVAIKLNFANYAFLFTDALYVSSYLYSVKVAAVSTILCLLLGYRWPMPLPLGSDLAQRAAHVGRAAVLDLPSCSGSMPGSGCSRPTA